MLSTNPIKKLKMIHDSGTPMKSSASKTANDDALID